MKAPRMLRACLFGLAWCAAGPAAAQSIYSCIDAQGRHLKSDRPMMACMDREQRELTSTGATRRVIPPAPTRAEREAQAARERERAAANQRARHRIQRDQALLARYPDTQTHEAVRNEALAHIQQVVDAAEHRIAELGRERLVIDEELEFFDGQPARAPARLRQALADNAESLAQQQRVIQDQYLERARIEARFDEEAARLHSMWRARGTFETARQ